MQQKNVWYSFHVSTSCIHKLRFLYNYIISGCLCDNPVITRCYGYITYRKWCILYFTQHITRCYGYITYRKWCTRVYHTLHVGQWTDILSTADIIRVTPVIAMAYALANYEVRVDNISELTMHAESAWCLTMKYVWTISVS